MTTLRFTAEASPYAASQYYRSAAVGATGGSILFLRNNCADIWDSRAEESISFAVRACGARRRSAGAVSACRASSSIVLHASTAGKSAVHRPVFAYRALSGAVSRLYNAGHKLIVNGSTNPLFELTGQLLFLVTLLKGGKIPDCTTTGCRRG